MSRRTISSLPGARAAVLLLLLAAASAASADTFTFSSDKSSFNMATGSQHALLTGNAVVQTEDLRITADQIELFGKDYAYAQCHGNIHVVDTKRGLDITGQDMFYDKDQKIARVRGNVEMQDLKNEMVVKAGFIEDRDTEQLDLIQIGVRIFKKDIVCRSEFARYQRDKKVLELSGMPWVSKSNDIYQGTRITINLDTEEVNAEGNVQGSIENKPKETPKETPPSGS